MKSQNLGVEDTLERLCQILTGWNWGEFTVAYIDADEGAGRLCVKNSLETRTRRPGSIVGCYLLSNFLGGFLSELLGRDIAVKERKCASFEGKTCEFVSTSSKRGIKAMNLSDPLNDRRVQALLNKFMSGRVKALTPLFDLKKVLVYPEVKEIVGDSDSAEEFLSKLHEYGILNRELYDRIFCCPKCESVNVSHLYSCPFCGSFDIVRSSLIEHIKCGYMDVEEKFRNKDGLVCPKCGRTLAGMDVDFRRGGVWCTCNKCRKSFDIPFPRHFCRDCQTKFTFEDAKLKDAYKYNLNEDVVKTVATDWSILAPIGKLLEDRGFKVEIPGFVEGRSGVRHMFDMIAYNNGRKSYKVAVNISTSTDGKPVQEQAIIDMFAKAYDSNIEKTILIAMPKIGENGKRLANLYKIRIVETKNPEEASEKVKDSL